MRTENWKKSSYFHQKFFSSVVYINDRFCNKKKLATSFRRPPRWGNFLRFEKMMVNLGPKYRPKNFWWRHHFWEVGRSKQLLTSQLQSSWQHNELKLLSLNDRSWSTFFFKISNDNFDPALKITRKTELSKKVFWRLWGRENERRTENWKKNSYFRQKKWSSAVYPK